MKKTATGPSTNLWLAEAELIELLTARLSPGIKALGGKVVAVEKNAVTLALDWRAELVGNPENGALMGGVITTLIDDVSAKACYVATNGTRFPLGTLDLRVEHMRSSRQGKTLHVRSECHRIGRQVAFFRAKAWHSEEPEDEVASGYGTFMLADIDPAVPAEQKS